MKFKSLKEVLENPVHDLIDCDIDFENFTKMNQVKLLLLTLWDYIDLKGLPDFYSDETVFM